MSAKILSKVIWRQAIGAFVKPRRLKLSADKNGNIYCPINTCDSSSFKSVRGCRKHVSTKHGWYFYFDVKPDVAAVLPNMFLKDKEMNKTKKVCTRYMPTFSKTIPLFKQFVDWLISPGGGGKSKQQAEQISAKLLKYLRFCCSDVSAEENVPFNVVDYCLGSVDYLSRFVDMLTKEWKVGFAGSIGYMNSISHALDYRRSSGLSGVAIQIFIMSEVYLQRVKRSLAKKMRTEWKHVLSIDYLDSMNCWASLSDLQKVIPFHSDRFHEIIARCEGNTNFVSPSDLTYSTSFVVGILFLKVKATRPMTYQFLSVDMVNSIKSDSFIDQTVFKTSEQYGFDSLLFSTEALIIVKQYLKWVRPRLNPASSYLLINRNGRQLSKLTELFGKLVFDAIGKYIHPTRYCQIIETASAESLSAEEQRKLSNDQKHSSHVAKIHYQKQRSSDVAQSANQCIQRLIEIDTLKQLPSIGLNLPLPVPDFQVTESDDKTPVASNNEIEKQNNSQLQLPHKTAEFLKKPNGRRKKVPFSSEEDQYLLQGLNKYGKGRWTQILNDADYKFHAIRQIATLQRRAQLLNLMWDIFCSILQVVFLEEHKKEKFYLVLLFILHNST